LCLFFDAVGILYCLVLVFGNGILRRFMSSWGF
jgi:hypothetical protein